MAPPNILNLPRSSVKMLDRCGYLGFSAIPRHQTGACNRRVSKRSHRPQGTARKFSSPSQSHDCYRADLPYWPEDCGKMVHSEWVLLGHRRPQQGFHYGLGWEKWEMRGKRRQSAFPRVVVVHASVAETREHCRLLNLSVHPIVGLEL